MLTVGTPLAFADDKPRLVAQLGHSLAIWDIAFSPDGRHLVTGSNDRTAQIWFVETRSAVRRLVGHAGKIFAVAWSPDGRWVLTGATDGAARLWEVSSGETFAVFEHPALGVWSVAFSADGATAYTAGGDGTVRAWDTGSGGERSVIADADAAMTAVAASPCGRWVAVGGKGGLLQVLETEGYELHVEIDIGAVVPRQFAFSADGGRLAMVDREGGVRLWAMEDGDSGRPIASVDMEATSVAFAPVGDRLAIGSGRGVLELWEGSTGEPLWAREDVGNTGMSTAVAFSPDGARIAVVRWPDRVAFVDLQGNEEPGLLEGRARPVTSLSLSSDEDLLLTAGFDGTLRLWDLTRGAIERSFPAAGSTARLSGDGRRALSDGDEGTALLWDVRSGDVLHRLVHGDQRVFDVQFADGDSHILTASTDGSAVYWDAETGVAEHRVRADGEGRFAFFSPTGAEYATAAQPQPGGNDALPSAIRLIDTRSGEVRCTFGEALPPIMYAAFSRDGQLALTGHGSSVLHGDEHTSARLWSTATCEQVQRFAGHTAAVVYAGLASEDRTVLTASFDNTARVWDVETGDEELCLRGHTDIVASIQLSSDGRHVYTGAIDGTVRVWDRETGQELCRLIQFVDGTWAVVDPEGRFDGSNLGEVEGLHWVVDNEPIALWQLKERYYEPGLLRKILRGEPLRPVERFGDLGLPPAVEVEALGEGRFEVRMVDRGGGLGRLQVLVNGKEIEADARAGARTRDGDPTTWVVDVGSAASVRPGEENRVRFVPWNGEEYLTGRGASRTWEATGEADRSPPQLWAIVGGVSDYEGDVLDLRYAAKDAREFAGALEVAARRLFGEDSVHISLLADDGGPDAQPPTSANIAAAFEAARDARPQDVLVVYLAGHGVATTTVGSSYAYLTAEARSADPGVLADPEVRRITAVTAEQLVSWIKEIPTTKQVFLLDTCSAGAAIADLVERRDIPGDQVRAIERLRSRTGFHVLMGCAADRVSYEASNYRQGLLTYALLEGMAGAALRDGSFVDVAGLFQYTADRVPELAVDVGGIQRPLIASPGGLSFDIGQLGAEERKSIRLASPLPLVCRPRAVDVREGYDVLDLEARLLAALRAQPTADGDVHAVFVDADSMPGAARPTLLYRRQGKRLIVNARLVVDGEPVSTCRLAFDPDDLDRVARHTLATLLGQWGRTEGP